MRKYSVVVKEGEKIMESKEFVRYHLAIEMTTRAFDGRRLKVRTHDVYNLLPKEFEYIREHGIDWIPTLYRVFGDDVTEHDIIVLSDDGKYDVLLKADIYKLDGIDGIDDDFRREHLVYNDSKRLCDVAIPYLVEIYG